jgi:hypothetical protein
MATDEDLLRYEGRAEAVTIMRDMLGMNECPYCGYSPCVADCAKAAARWDAMTPAERAEEEAMMARYVAESEGL